MKKVMIFFILFFLIECSQGLIQKEEKAYAWVTLPRGTRIKAEIVDTPQKRALGLMFRDELKENEGMLFIFERSDFHSFWMKNMKFSIDIIWLNRESQIVYIAAHVPPCKEEPCPSYQPYQKAIYVLELAAGMAEREELKIGSQINIEFPSDYPNR